MIMFIKVCGITSTIMIDWAIELGYSAIGLVLHPPSIRYIPSDKALKLSAYAQGKITTVGVGITWDEVKDIYNHVDYIQIYEPVHRERLILAGTSIPPEASYDYFLYDTSRGSGMFRGLPSWLDSIHERLILSGGLDLSNINRVVREKRCFGIDVSSGVEEPRGIKSYTLMKRFIEEVSNEIK